MPRIAVAAVVVALAALPVVILRSASSHEATVGVSVDLTPVPFATSGYTIHRVPAGQAPYAGEYAERKDELPTDDDGVRQKIFRGVAHDHPVLQAQWGIRNLNSYVRDKDVFFLERARVQARRLIATRTEVRTPDGTAAFFPYPFDFALHGGKGFTAKAPWYSAMAQGQALSLFSRLVTADPDNARTWRTAADEAYRSLLVQPSAHAPWTVHVDRAGYLWLDEYPDAAHPGHSDLTLNGQNFAIFGLYDYYLLTHDAQVAEVFDGAVTTTVRYYPEFRNEGSISSYCLAHPEVVDAKYHRIHAAQMRKLHRITRDPFFARAADELTSDYSAPAS
jgi:hypothetical protein